MFQMEENTRKEQKDEKDEEMKSRWKYYDDMRETSWNK